MSAFDDLIPAPAGQPTGFFSDLLPQPDIGKKRQAQTYFRAQQLQEKQQTKAEDENPENYGVVDGKVVRLTDEQKQAQRAINIPDKNPLVGYVEGAKFIGKAFWGALADAFSGKNENLKSAINEPLEKPLPADIQLAQTKGVGPAVTSAIGSVVKSVPVMAAGSPAGMVVGVPTAFATERYSETHDPLQAAQSGLTAELFPAVGKLMEPLGSKIVSSLVDNGIIKKSNLAAQDAIKTTVHQIGFNAAANLTALPEYAQMEPEERKRAFLENTVQNLVFSIPDVLKIPRRQFEQRQFIENVRKAVENQKWDNEVAKLWAPQPTPNAPEQQMKSAFFDDLIPMRPLGTTRGRKPNERPQAGPASIPLEKPIEVPPLEATTQSEIGRTPNEQIQQTQEQIGAAGGGNEPISPRGVHRTEEIFKGEVPANVGQGTQAAVENPPQVTLKGGVSSEEAQRQKELQVTTPEAGGAIPPASVGDVIARVTAMPDDQASKLKQGRESISEGLKLTEADVPALKAASDAEFSAAKDAGEKQQWDKYQAHYGRGIWLNAVIEGAQRKGPNYDITIKENPDLIGGERTARGEKIEKPAAKEPWQMTQAEFVAKHKAIDAAWQMDKSKPSTMSFGTFYGKDYQNYLDAGKYGNEVSYLTYEQQKHRSEVKHALSEGKPVPPEVLADYPDLQKPTPQPPVSAKAEGGGEFQDWRVQGTTVRHSRVGQKLTKEQAQSIMQQMENAGLRGRFDESKGTVVLNSGVRSDLENLWREKGSFAKSEAKTKAAKQSIEDQRQSKESERLKELSESPSVKWIDEVFGADAMNSFNKLELAKYLEGKTDKFGGAPSNKWQEGLSKLGATSISEIRDAYRKSQQPEPKGETPTPSKLTPMMQQYQRIKEKLPSDALLMFRLGDFYEFFFDDASKASKALNIALTKRGDVAMAGIPYHAKDSYISKLLKEGHRVAIVENVAEEGSPAKREVTQILTPEKKGETPNAEAVRSNQGPMPEEGRKPEGVQNKGGENLQLPPQGRTEPVGTGAKEEAVKYRVGTNPTPHTLIERLPQSEAEKANNEQPVRVRNDRTGEESVVLESDLTAVRERAPSENQPKADLDAELRKRGMDPSVFPDAKSKRAAIKRHDETQGRPLAADLGAGLPEGQGMSRDAVVELVRGEPAHGVEVHVIDRDQAVEITGYSEAAGYGGFEWGGKAYLVHENIGSPEGAKQILREEVAHAMLRSEQGQRLIDSALASGRLHLTEQERALLKEAGYRDEQLLDEFIAKAAREEQPWWRNAVDVVKEWLSRLGLKIDNATAARILLKQLTKSEHAPIGAEPEVPFASPPDKNEATPPEMDEVNINGRTYAIPYKPRYTPEQRVVSIARVRQTVKSFGFPGADDTRVDRRPGSIDNNVVFKVEPDGELHDDDARMLTKHLIEQIQMQGQPGGDPVYVAELSNFITKNFNNGNFEGVLSKPVLDELINVAAGESSRIGQQLRLRTGISTDIQDVARNADFHLKWFYQHAFDKNETGVATMKRIMELFRQHFSEGEIADILKGNPDLESFYQHLVALNHEDAGSRLYQRLQRELKPKKPLTLEQLKSTALTEEAAQQTLDAYQAAGGKIPEATGKRKLTARETLAEVTTDKNIAKIQKALERAYFDAERNAAMDFMRRKIADTANLDERSALEDQLAELEADKNAVPDPDFVKLGLQSPRYSHWVRVRNVMGYSPTSIKLIEKLISTDFKGVRFKTQEAKIPDTRIDMAALARSPDTEVQRVFNAYLDGVRSNMAGATPEIQARVLKSISDRLVEQLENRRAEITGKAIGPTGPSQRPNEPKIPKSDTERLQELFNAGLLRDKRLVTQFVSNVASKPAFQKLVPKVGDLIQKVFDTPIAKQDDLRENFAKELAKDFNMPEAERNKAQELFESAFRDKFTQAKQSALKKAQEALTPKERAEFGNGLPAWERIERLVNAGGFTDAHLYNAMAREHRWNIPTEKELSDIREWANQAQALEEPTQAEIEKHGDYDAAKTFRQAVFQEQIKALHRKMETQWSIWTKPLMTNWRDTMDHVKVVNTNNAFGEFMAANLLAKLGFGTRQAVDVFSQMGLHTPTRAIAYAFEQWKNDVRANRDSELLHNISQSLIDAYRARLRVLEPALNSFKQTLKGNEQRQVEGLVSQLHVFDRMLLNAERMRAEGKRGAAQMLQLFAITVRMGRQFASAMDVIHGVPAEAQEIAHQVRTALRTRGLTKLQEDQQYNRIMDLLVTYRAEALAIARDAFAAEGQEPSAGELQRAAWHVMRQKIYMAASDAELPADQWHENNQNFRDLIGWNKPEAPTQLRRGSGIGGPGGLVFGVPGRLTKEFASHIPVVGGLLSAPLTFSNAMAIAMNRKLSWAPLGFFPGIFKGSPWYEGDVNIRQRKVEAAIGSTVGGLLASLVLTGIWKALPNQWPKDDKERAKWTANGWRPGMVIIPWGNGQEIHVSTTTGPLAYFSPSIAAAAAYVRAIQDRDKKQAVINEHAQRLGIPAEKLQGLDWNQWMSILWNAAESSVTGGRTAAGAIQSFTDYGNFNPKKAAAADVSAIIPGLPALNEFARLAGGNINPKMASFWDLLVPMPTSAAQRVNLLGDPMRDENDFRRIFQIMSGGNYPLPTSTSEPDKSYATLFGSEYRPPSINPSTGYNIDGKYRPLIPDELTKYTVARGQAFKQELNGLGDNPSDADVKAAFVRANTAALATVGAAIAPRSRKVGRIGTATLGKRRTSRLRLGSGMRSRRSGLRSRLTLGTRSKKKRITFA